MKNAYPQSNGIDDILAFLLQCTSDEWNKWRREDLITNIDFNKDFPRSFKERVFSGYDFSFCNFNYANFENCFFENVDLVFSTFFKANLTNAQFQKTILFETQFTEVNLSNSFFSDVKTQNVKFEKSSFHNSTIKNCQFINSNFSDVNFFESKIENVFFRNVNLSSTKFKNAVIGDLVFANSDLTDAQFLESVYHTYPSSIDFFTLLNSGGIESKNFLRGCGFRDIDIEFSKLFVPYIDIEQSTQIAYKICELYNGSPIQYYSCFISYCSKDEEFARLLLRSLQNEGIRCWFAPEDLKIGDYFRKRIGEQIRIKDKLVLIISEDSISSEWVEDEVEKAIEEERQTKTEKLFPIRIDDSIFSARDNWAEKIRLTRHIGDFSKWKSIAEVKMAFERLINDLQK